MERSSGSSESVVEEKSVVDRHRNTKDGLFCLHDDQKLEGQIQSRRMLRGDGVLCSDKPPSNHIYRCPYRRERDTCLDLSRATIGSTSVEERNPTKSLVSSRGFYCGKASSALRDRETVGVYIGRDHKEFFLSLDVETRPRRDSMSPRALSMHRSRSCSLIEGLTEEEMKQLQSEIDILLWGTRLRLPKKGGTSDITERELYDFINIFSKGWLASGEEDLTPLETTQARDVVLGIFELRGQPTRFYIPVLVYTDRYIKKRGKVERRCLAPLLFMASILAVKFWSEAGINLKHTSLVCGVDRVALLDFEWKFLAALEYSLFVSEDEALLYRSTGENGVFVQPHTHETIDATTRISHHTKTLAEYKSSILLRRFPTLLQTSRKLPGSIIQMAIDYGSEGSTDAPINGQNDTFYDEHGNVLEVYQDSTTGLWYSLNAKGTPVWRAAISAMATVAGIGVLGLSKGLSQAGWVGIPLLIFLGFMSNYTAKVLLKSMYLQRETVTTTYHGLSRVAFGTTGYYIVIFMQNLALFSASTLFLVLSGINIHDLFKSWGLPEFHMAYYVAATGLIVLLPIVGLKTLREVSWIAVFGIAATVLTIIIIIVMPPIMKSVTLSGNMSHPQTTVISTINFPTAFATMVFAFGGHNVFPALASTMRDTRSYGTFLNVAFVCVIILYLPPAILPYIYFGDAVKSPVLESLSTAVAGLSRSYTVPIDLALVAITLHLWLTIPILNNPVFLYFEEVTRLDKAKAAPVYRILYRTAILALQVLVACVVKDFGDFMDLLGSTVISATVFFFPCLMYLKLNWNNIPVYEKMWNYVVLLLASLGSIVGFISASIELGKDFTGRKDFQLDMKTRYIIIGSTTGAAAILLALAFHLIAVKNRRSGYQAI
ncbi:hypothetical protein PROFUN_04044 [Planoprotostelium fungivorum]|uniref:Amino acid transporter transmembrane domain-containing protein n=1 Tax=Planoprotostelium fungivorum TaxID=1890364 RepID=A0A2P6NW86_9EUKA|nr:hypothetical protein PROFUN_04044 [Planoprotostelium fungivorum]